MFAEDLGTVTIPKICRSLYADPKQKPQSPLNGVSVILVKLNVAPLPIVACRVHCQRGYLR